MLAAIAASCAWTGALEARVLNLLASLPGVPPGITALLSLTPGDVLTQATFSRASSAAQITSAGLVSNVPAGTIRDGHYENGVRTFLLEPAATNRILHNGTIDNASWTTENVTSPAPGVTGGIVVDPTGTAAGASAISFVPVTAAGARSTLGQTPAGQPLAPQVFSYWLRGNLGSEVIYMMATNDGVTFQSVQLNLTDKWKRYSLVTGSGGNYRVSLGIDLRDPAQTAKSVVANVYVWGAQLEDGSVMTSTIYPVVASPVTRAQDVLSIPGTPVSPAPVAMTVYAQYVDRGLAAKTGVLCSFGNAANRFTLDSTNTPGFRLNLRSASADHTAVDTASVPAFGDTVEVLASMTLPGACSLQHTKNGSPLTTAGTVSTTPPAAWDTSTIEIASLGGAQQGGIALAALIICAGVVAYARARTAAKKAIATGPDITPAFCVLSPSAINVNVGAADIACTTTVTNQAGAVLSVAQAPVAFSSDTPSVFTVNSSTGLVHVVGAGTGVLRAQTSVAGVFDTTPVTVNPTAPPTRSLIYPHARFRIIERWVGATDTATANAFFSDIDGGTKTSHPNAISVQHYGILLTSESNEENSFDGVKWTAPNDFPLVLFLKYADAYATAQGQNVEDYWLHAQVGQANNVAGIYNISSAGVVSFWYPLPGGGPVSSYPFTPGQTVTLSGLSAGNGTYTIASLQKYGITLNGWSAGALGPAGTNGHSKIGTVSTPGDGTLVKANRLQSFGWASWVLQCSFVTAGAKAMHAQRFADVRGDTNAVLIDNMASGNYNSMSVSQEYGAQLFDSNIPPQRIAAPQFVTDVATTLTGILAQSGGPTYLRINSSVYVSGNDAKLDRAAKGVHGESLLTLTDYDGNLLNYVIARVAEGVDIEYSNGTSYVISGGVSTMTGLPGGYNAGNYASASDRGRMSIYAMYLLAVDKSFIAADGSTQKHCIFDFTNGFAVGQGPLSALILPAYRYNIGQPTGPMVQVQHTDASGQPVRTQTRTFSLDGGATLSAVVLFNSSVNGQSNYGDNSLVTTALPAAPVGSSWFMLKPDGTLGTTPLTSVAHRRSEGVIVVAQSVGVLAARADAFVDSVGLNLKLDNSAYVALFAAIIVATVQVAGFRTIRSKVYGSGQDAQIGLTSLLTAETGASLILTTQRGSSNTDQSAQSYMTGKIDPATVFAYEGPQDVDASSYALFGNAAGVTAFMAALESWRDNNVNATIRATPIATPAVQTPGGEDWTAYANFGNAHPYPGSSEPGAPLAAALAASKSTYSGLAALLVTESGYETTPNATIPPSLIGSGVTEAAQAKYLPRLVAEYFQQGVTRSAIMELLDEGSDPSNALLHYGLISSAGVPKAAYASLANLVAILSERAWTPPVAVQGSVLASGVFATANQNGWPDVTGADTAKSWSAGPSSGIAGLKLSGTFYGIDPVASGTVDATLVASGAFAGIDPAKGLGYGMNSDASGDFGLELTEATAWAIVSNRGQLLSGPAENLVGDAHSGDVEVFGSFRTVRANYSNLCRLFARWTIDTSCYALDFNPGLAFPLTISKNLSTALAAGAKAGYTTLVNPNMRLRVRTVGNDIYLYARIWDSAGAEPSTWDLMAVDVGAASGALASGKIGLAADDNFSGGKIGVTAFTSWPVTVTPGSRAALAPLTLGRLPYNYTGAPATLEDTLLQKADGSFYLLVWNRVSCFNSGSKTDIVNAPVAVTITFPATHTVQQATPSAGTGFTFLATASTATFNLTDEVTVLHIT